MTQIDKKYDPLTVEDKWYAYWINKGFFHADENSRKKPFCIVIPPPNITGSLHMGHALNNTLQDILIRYKRMDGYNALWLPGTDHAGIAAQIVVERKLSAEGVDRKKIGREKFVEEIWKWKKESGGTIINQLKKLGSSCDWERERFTLDDGLSAAVRENFVRLYEEGLIYKGNYIINWCPHCLTALSDLEVEYSEQKGYLYFLKYLLSDSTQNDFITIATTRPETMLGDTAIAVNPGDERYQKFIGKEVLLPLINRKIPIIADSYVDQTFGSGALKITPAHDPNDFEIGKRHKLASLKIMNENAVINEMGGKYNGLDRYKCRKVILADLAQENLLIKKEDYLHSVGHCYRCRTVIEPMLSKQWFVRMQPLAAPAIEAVKNKKIKIIPEGWENTYFEWMNNIRDWCISRQIWWGHQIPAWTCNHCQKIIVARITPHVCPHCQGDKLIQETDVLDTWFSSGLWPFSTLGWPEKTKALETFYPTSVLVTGFDIIFFWVARMIMFGIKFMDEVPFKDVYIHALVRDAQGQKMSKSKGNVIDPLTMISKYGTDAFRFTLAAFAAQGRDISLAEERIEGYRNFTNKLWNAARFVLMNLENYEKININTFEPGKLALTDRWILSRLEKTVGAVRISIDTYKFNNAANDIYQFLWHEYCDWYIEMVKSRLLSPDFERTIAQNVLLHVLETSLRLLHPLMPFITEEIWQAIPHQGESIMLAPYPAMNKTFIDETAEMEINLIINLIGKVRNFRSESNIPPGAKLNKLIIQVKNTAKEKIIQNENQHILIFTKTAPENLIINTDEKSLSEYRKLPGVIPFIADEDIEGLIIPQAISAESLEEKLKKMELEIKKNQEKIVFIKQKLENPNFTSKAPKDVVEKNLKEKQQLETETEKLITYRIALKTQK